MLRYILCSVLIASAAVAADPHAGHGSKPKTDRKSEQGVISLDVAADGERVHLFLGTRSAGKPPELTYLTSHDGGETWSNPVVVGSGQPAPEPAHRGMDAQIAARGDRVVAVWTTEGKEDRFGRGPMASAFSTDGGKTWTAGPNPADDGSATGHAFIDIAADDQGVFHLVWLDGRNAPPTPAAILANPTTRPASTGKGLRYARSADGGATWSPNATIDPQTCECCWNTLLTGPDGRVYVLYRDFSPRDMSVARSDDAGLTWSKPTSVGAFGWDVAACPHVGGALALGDAPGDLFASVWTAKDNDHHGGYVLSSRDAGATWNSPQQLGKSDSWHTDFAYAGGHLVATWDAYVEGGTAVFTSSSADRHTWTSPQRLSGRDVSATHPRVVATPSGARVFWTQRESGKESRWMTTKVIFMRTERPRASVDTAPNAR